MEESKIEPISEISGNIEIAFNTKNLELDPYEPLTNQIVLTIGKTGRANRLTFDELDSEAVLEAGKTLQAIASEISRIEESEKIDEDEDFDVDVVESGINGYSLQIKQELDGQAVDKEDFLIKMSQKLNTKKEKIDEVLDQLMRDGEIYEPDEGMIRKM